MIYVEGFRRERESPASVHFQFLLKATRFPNGIHAFFEGPGDLSFYTNFLHRFVTNAAHVWEYKCGNKKGVYEVYSKIKKGTWSGVMLFFVDKDLSDILEEDWEKAATIYTTDYYSIENYLVSEEMLLRIWSELFRFKQGELEFDQVHSDKFCVELERFYQLVLPMMAWAVYLRRKGMRPNVNNINFTRFFDWSEDMTLVRSNEVQRVGELKLLEQVCGVETPDSWVLEAEAIIQELSNLAPKTYIRGKLELCFFVRFVEKFLKFLDKNMANVGGGATLKTPLGEENAIEILGPRVSIPSSLEQFLRKNLVTM